MHYFVKKIGEEKKVENTLHISTGEYKHVLKSQISHLINSTNMN